MRILTLGDQIMQKLIEHQERQKIERAAAGDHWQEHDLIFPTVIGTPIDPHNLLKDFKALLVKAGLPMMRFHDLRLTSITLVLNDIGAPVKEAQHRAGHATPSTTINIYGGDVTSKLDDMVTESLDDLVTPVPLDLGPKAVKEEEEHYR